MFEGHGEVGGGPFRYELSAVSEENTRPSVLPLNRKQRRRAGNSILARRGRKGAESFDLSIKYRLRSIGAKGSVFNTMINDKLSMINYDNISFLDCILSDQHLYMGSTPDGESLTMIRGLFFP